MPHWRIFDFEVSCLNIFFSDKITLYVTNLRYTTFYFYYNTRSQIHAFDIKFDLFSTSHENNNFAQSSVHIASFLGSSLI